MLPTHSRDGVQKTNCLPSQEAYNNLGFQSEKILFCECPDYKCMCVI